MAAPIKKNATSTSASRFVLLVVGISLLALALFGAAKLQRSPILRPASQPQVQGSSTQNEYVPQQDVVAPTVQSPDNANEPYLVTAVSDGDTIKVRIGNKTETVRFIGVDTPRNKRPT